MRSLRTLIKDVLAIYLSYVTQFLGITFPKKYSVRWKLDFLLGTYERETARLLRSLLRPGMVMIDIGAHIGYFTRLGSSLVGSRGRVIAFEPDRENFALLEANTKSRPNVKRERDALSDVEGRVPFYHARNSTGCHSLIPTEGESSGEIVFATTLDSYLARNGIPHVDVIKMDIEGGEWKALAGMEKTLRTPNLKLVIEYNPEALQRSGIEPHDLLRRLIASGYTIAMITKRGIKEIPPADFGTIDHYLEAGSVNVYCVHA